MPNAVVKKYAKETGKSPEHIEGWWKEAEAEALKKFPKKGPHYWAYVNGIVEKRGKLVHGKRKKRKTNESFEFENTKMTFKQFISEAPKQIPTDKNDIDTMIQSFVDDAIDKDMHETARDKGSPEDGAEYLMDEFKTWLGDRGYDSAEIDKWMNMHEDDVYDFLYQGLT